MMLENITNFLVISPNLGTAGQPQREQFPMIQGAGYELVVNLVPSTSPDALADEAGLVAAQGMEYRHIPVLWDAPAHENLLDFFAVLEQKRDRKIFAHCVMNMRVSAFVFLYRCLRLNEPVETAQQAMLEIWQPNETWQKFIDECLARREAFSAGEG